MKNLLSHLIHLTFITEFEIFFYIYYIVPFERKNIYHMFDTEYNNNFVSYNISLNFCNKEEERMKEYNNKLNIICYYYIGCINFLLFLAFLYDLRKNYCFYFGNNDIPRVLSSPKYLSAAFSIEMIDIESDVVSENKEKEIKNKTDERFIIYYWKNSRFIAKMCETIQLIILLGVFEYVFFTYLFNKFKIVSAKLVLCKLLE